MYIRSTINNYKYARILLIRLAIKHYYFKIYVCIFKKNINYDIINII